MAEEITWTRLIYLGRRGDVTAWRAEEESGGAVLFLVPLSDLGGLVLGLRLVGRLVGVDQDRHTEMWQMLMNSGLGTHAANSLMDANGILRPPIGEPDD